MATPTGERCSIPLPAGVSERTTGLSVRAAAGIRRPGCDRVNACGILKSMNGKGTASFDCAQCDVSGTVSNAGSN